jgi:hypothetical protein
MSARTVLAAFSSVLAFVLAAPLTGCVSKATAREQARLAYLAGQRDALLHFQENLREGRVTFVGPVKHSSIEWFEGLTLIRAILQAEYSSPRDPARIVIRRIAEQIEVDPARLLSGDDLPLLPGDIVEFHVAAQ